MKKSPYRDRTSSGKHGKRKLKQMPLPPPVPPRRENRGTYAATLRPSGGRGKMEKPRRSRTANNGRRARYVTSDGTAWAQSESSKEKLQQPTQTKKRIILLLLLVVLAGIGVSAYFLWPLIFGGNECTNLELPLEYRAVVCQRMQYGKSCSFNPKSCQVDCPVGLETDEYACVVSCNCATSGVFESDVAYDKNNLQTLLSAYMTSEDHTVQLFSGSATNLLNIWNINKVGTSVRVPYVFSGDLDQSIISTVNSAIMILGNATCVELVLRRNEADYITFKDGIGCSSPVSRIGGEQYIVLSKECNSLGSIMHEIMHALGFWHEHSRADRADHVMVMWDNVDKSNQHQFNKRSIDTVFDFGSPYDIDSVMHGSGYSFSKDARAPTMLDLKTNAAVKIQRDDLSVEDIAEINALYECHLPSADSVKGATWGEWSEVGLCSMTCGKGVQYKLRECVDEDGEIVPRRYCGSEYHSEAECYSGECKQGMWGPWSPCDHTCGLGTRKRTSCCGLDATTAIENCNKADCTEPAPAFWGEWQGWGDCLRSCGNGMRRRYRSCFDMFNTRIEYLRCPQVGTAHLQVEICAPDPCPVDEAPVIGNWGVWGEWGACSRTCGVGSEKRDRVCLSQDGSIVKYCLGEAMQLKPCNMSVCSAPVVSLWTPWEPWSDCSKKCGGGTRSRTRKCHSATPLTIDTDCGESTELVDKEKRTETCHNEPCNPRKTMWAEWESWGECSKDCQGEQWRLRSCVGGSLGDPECPWNGIYDKRACNEDPCDIAGRSLAEDPNYTGPRWAPWYQWGECSVTCDGGWTKRYRLCETVDKVMSYNCVENNKTSGHQKDRKRCNTKLCRDPDTTWTKWEGWSACTATCGRGIQTRKRECVAQERCKGRRLGSKVCVLASCSKIKAKMNKKPKKGIFASEKLSRFFGRPKVTKKPKVSSKPIFQGKAWSRRGSFCDKGSRLYLGDFNGDAKKDMLCLNLKGRIKIAYAAAAGSYAKVDWEMETGFCGLTIGLVYAIDFDGDGADDLMCYDKDSGKYTVMFSQDGKFDGRGGEIEGQAPSDFCRKLTQTLYAVDVNMDGKGDLVCRDVDEEKVLFNE